MALTAVAGSKIFIGPQTDDKPTDFTEAEFDALTGWIEVDGWETMGGFGDSAALISTSLINRGRDIKQKGTRNAGSMENNFTVLPDDAGQIAVNAAEATNKNYAFKVEYDDLPTAGTNPTTDFFVGLVMGKPETGGTANTIRMFSPTIEINSNVVRKAAA